MDTTTTRTTITTATRRVALSVKPDFDTGRWRWCFAWGSTSRIGNVDAAGREDALLCAVAAAHRDLIAEGPVAVVVTLPDSPRLWSLADAVAEAYAGLSLTPYTAADAELRAKAVAALDRRPTDPTSTPANAPASPPTGPLTVATDGSAHRGRIGWGWLAADGRHAYAAATPSPRESSRRRLPLLAELRAISAAVAALPDRPLSIRTDSQDAIDLVCDWMTGGTRLPFGYAAQHHTATRKGGLLWMQDQVRCEAHRLDVQWVRGHVGDPLNEGADSLAKLARRHAEGTWGLLEEELPARARSIAEVFATADHQPSAA